MCFQPQLKAHGAIGVSVPARSGSAVEFIRSVQLAFPTPELLQWMVYTCRPEAIVAISAGLVYMVGVAWRLAWVNDVVVQTLVSKRLDSSDLLGETQHVKFCLVRLDVLAYSSLRGEGSLLALLIAGS